VTDLEAIQDQHLLLRKEEFRMSAIGNVLWFVFGGFLMGLGWWLAGLLCAITIVGLPWAKSCFVIGQFAFLPFGKEAISRDMLSGTEDVGTGPFGAIGNVLWFIVAGVWLAIGHVASALACFITIIGIPFGVQHLKLALLALAPVGKTIVTNETADASRLYAAQAAVARQRS
jgi:uncharacterized membrane protein YccF (DUF307 family)